jgi:hypothetical protein
MGGSANSEESNLAADLPETARIAVKSGRAGLALMLDEAQVLVDDKNLIANLLKARTYSERMFRGEEVCRLTRD